MFPRLTVLLVLVSMTASWVRVVTPILLGRITNDIQMRGRALPPGSVAKEPSGDVPPRSRELPGGGPDKAGQSPGPVAEQPRSLIGSYVLWLACAFGGIGLGLGMRYAQSALDVNMANAIRSRLFSRIIRERLEFFHAHDAGRLTLLINQMSVEAQVAVRQTVLEPVFQTIGFLLAASGLAYSFAQLQQEGGSLMAWMGVVVVILVAMLSPFLVSRFGRRLQASSAAVLGQNMALASLVSGSLNAPEEVQSFNAEEFFASKFGMNLEGIRASRIRQTVIVEVINALNALPTVLIEVLLVGVALSMVLWQPSSPTQAGFLVSIVLLAPSLMMPIQGISCYMVMLRSSWPSVQAVLAHLDNRPEAPGLPREERGAAPSPELEARNIVFRYRPELPAVFDRVSFKVPPGTITGLVARMGQGKTTFFRLALGFYAPQEGEILLGGRPTSHYPLSELRQHVSMMAQFPAFFHDTLRENLRIAEPRASDAEIEALCRRTGVWGILEENVGAKGEGVSPANPLDRQFAGGQWLSGGQKKLLALTRCLLRSPTFLLLDEPTVGMDNDEKYRLVTDLRGACAGKTVMVVDHDILWLMKFCDHFIVLDEGRAVQQGTGHDLLSQPGLFRDLYEKTGRVAAVV